MMVSAYLRHEHVYDLSIVLLEEYIEPDDMLASASESHVETRSLAKAVLTPDVSKYIYVMLVNVLFTRES